MEQLLLLDISPDPAVLIDSLREIDLNHNLCRN